MAETCGKLVMLTASAAEKATLATSSREEFDFRVDACVKSTVHRVHAQPEFSNPKIVARAQQAGHAAALQPALSAGEALGGTGEE